MTKARKEKIMKYGIVKCGAITPEIKVCDTAYNADAVIQKIAKAKAAGVEIAVFPELCVTGYTAMDMFFTRELLHGAVEAVKKIASAVPENMLVFVGAPVRESGRLYNCAIGMSGGRLLGIVPKTELPDYGEFFEKRYFTPAFDGVIESEFGVPMGNVLFKCNELTVGCEICEDMWTDAPPSIELCRAGANIIVNLSASDEVVGKADYRRLLVAGMSGRLHCGYVYADAGRGEAVTDVVFSAHNMVAENGGIVAESEPFGNGFAVGDIDVQKLDVERRKIGLKPASKTYATVEFGLGDGISLEKSPERYPFVPSGEEKAKRAELILTMQSRALKARFDDIHCKTAVIGVSGGLDSALALLVACRAVGGDKITAVTMPCFGTTNKTVENAENLCAALGVKLDTIDIKNTVESHLKDISHADIDVTYENTQARTRTMTLFDIANKKGGLVVGTGDLSELALGWATYNGDHMSSYGVNAGVPKTLVKHLVAYEGARLGGAAAKAVNDILGTEISPELLPPEKGKIAQKTEDILGKYDLLDFIIYYYCRFGFCRKKISFLLREAFKDVKKAELDKALDTFYKRFAAAQFKRSCLPDGVKIGSVSFSPRSDWRMPS